MTKEEFTNMYNKEMEELSHVESAINELGFQMDGVVDKHKHVENAFKNYAENHKSEDNEFYYGFVADKVVKNWESFMSVCFELWNFPNMSKNSLERFYTYIYSAFEMMEEGTFTFKDYVDADFQTYVTNLNKFFGTKIVCDIYNTFIEYLKSKNDWHDEYFIC